VVIKPNLVVPMNADTGATTDPEVVRALVDLALEAKAAQVLIAEGGINGAHFSACGYDFFDRYDARGRVSLVDLSAMPVVLAKVPHGTAYHRIYMPKLLLGDDVFFISAAKLKTHSHTFATLSMKNLVGLPPVQIYREGDDQWRWVMHYRGISQVIVDLNLVRPIDFAVVDGSVGMEGQGPVIGDPVRLDLVLAGRNALAVDRTCLWATALPQLAVRHLTYAGRSGLGPADLSGIQVVGDSFEQRAFVWSEDVPPLVEYPRPIPRCFAPCAGQETRITYRVLSCKTRVEVIRISELSPEVTLIRTLHDWEDRPAGSETLVWDGRDDEGQVVPPGRYTVRVQARYSADGNIAYATGCVMVGGSPV
jgi:uncharacterized protein (DUF362 family)